MKRFSCIIFDLDGTLSQTNGLIFATFNHVAEKYLQKKFTASEIIAMFGPTEEVAIELLVGADKADEAMDDFCKYYEMHHPRLAVAYNGIQELLQLLKERGIILALFTGKGKRTTLITLQKLGIKKFFDAIVTGNDVENHKPSADGIRKVLKTFRLQASEVLMVGDAVSDVKAAHEAGVSIAAVLWDSYGKENVMQMDVDYSFHNVGEFAEWLRATVPTNGEHVH